MLSKADILSIQDRIYETLVIPEWQNRRVRIRSLTAGEVSRYHKSVSHTSPDGTVINKLENATAKWNALVIVDENGSRIFDDSDVGALANKNAGAMARIFKRSTLLSGVGDEAITETVEELEANPTTGSS